MELKEFTKKIKLKKIFKMTKEKVTDYIKNNYLFSVYLVLSVITTFTVRLLTTKSVFDYRPLITDLGLIIIFGSFSLLYKTQKQKYTYLKVWLILYTAMGLANDIYYAFYSSFASFSELSSLGQATGVTNSFIERIEISQFVYILAPVAFSFIYRRYTKKKSIFNFPQKDVKKKLRYTLIIGLLFVLLSFSTTKIQDYSRLYKLWNRTYVVDRFGIITYEIMDSFTSVTTKSILFLVLKMP